MNFLMDRMSAPLRMKEAAIQSKPAVPMKRRSSLSFLLRIGKLQVHARHVEGLVGLELAAADDQADHLVARAFGALRHALGADFQLAVVQQDALARAHQMDEAGIGNADLPRFRIARPGHQSHFGAVLQIVFARVHAHLGTHQIGKDADGTLQLGGGAADEGEVTDMLRPLPVGKVDAEAVGPRFDDPFQDGGVFEGRAHGR